MAEIISSKCTEISSGTSLSAEVLAEAGDIVLATVTVRSPLAILDGWELLYTSPEIENTGTVQTLSFATKKVIQSGNISINVQQADSKRIYINLIVLRGVKKVVPYLELETISNSKKTQIVVPEKREGEMIIWGCSSILWTSSSPYGSWETSPDDLQLITLDQSKTAPRQANFVDLGKGGKQRSFSAPTELQHIIAAVKLIEYDSRYLVQDGAGKSYMVVDGSLQQVEIAELTGQAFLDYGLTEKPKGSFLLALDNPKLLYWQDSQNELPVLSAHITAVPPPQTICTETQDMSDLSISWIENMKVDTTENVLFAFAFIPDKWMVYNTDAGQWEEATEGTGMTKTQVEAITAEQWKQLAGESKLYWVRFMVPDETGTMNNIVVNYKNQEGITA